ncbi:hypothetical protein THAR02_04032 [Trichoderma harzianum]|uniref:Uncharacterized protein n=1 Tax=Trichoderma harzianum TaxID=5544 RepID=A0A0F9XUX2_TRIHA|nr:hypothetical protein THAR02_04032 [Trichoderma harzianum]
MAKAPNQEIGSELLLRPMQRNLRKILEAYRIERWGATADRRPCASGGRVYDREPSKQEVEEQSIELRLRGFEWQP